MHTSTIKKQILGSGTDNDIWEYLLAVCPGNEINEKVIKEKEWFYHAYNHSSAGKPSIPIASFLAKEILEETLIRWMQRICNLQKSFAITLNNFSGIPAHTIYLRVQDHQPFRQLASQMKMIDQFIQSNNCPAARFSTFPYLAIARNLSDDLYNQAINEYSRRSFHESFQAETLVLIKRNRENESFKLVNMFTLPPGFSLYE